MNEWNFASSDSLVCRFTGKSRIRTNLTLYMRDYRLQLQAVIEIEKLYIFFWIKNSKNLVMSFMNPNKT